VIREVRSKQAIELLESTPDLTVADIAGVFSVGQDTASNYIKRGLELKSEAKRFGKGVDPETLD
jgi:Fic family protein